MKTGFFSIQETVGKVHIWRVFNLLNKFLATQHSVLLEDINQTVPISPLLRQSLQCIKLDL